jgi:hypothetical protein
MHELDKAAELIVLARMESVSARKAPLRPRNALENRLVSGWGNGRSVSSQIAVSSFILDFVAHDAGLSSAWRMATGPPVQHNRP